MQLGQAEIQAYLAEYYGRPVKVRQIHQLGGGAVGAAALKAFGYGQPLCVDYDIGGERGRVVLRRISANGFGHERDADRVAEVWLDFATFNRLPRHVAACDMAALQVDGRLTSVGRVQELLLLTEYASGQPYAEDLLRIRDSGELQPLDLARAQALAHYLAQIHDKRHDDPLLWRRRLRDLVGDGEGIMGLTESYPPDFPLASPAELRRLENAANAWRWRLMPANHRLVQVHGDFHPFNVLFSSGNDFRLLDRSRGEWGEAADDVSCMAINFLFFSLQRYGQLAGPFRDLYTAFWQTYIAGRRDDEMSSVIQPWYAWRALVLASPRWYPTLIPEVRRLLLNFARRVMAEDDLPWNRINDYLNP